MRKGVGHDIALRLLLDAIVADGARRPERILDVARLDDVLTFLGAIGPDAGETIGLKLHAHLQGIGLCLPHALFERFDLIGDAEKLLHVMADLMRNDVGLRHVSWRAEAVLEVLVEVEVDIDLLVEGAIKGTHLRHADSASGTRSAAEQHERGIAIALPITGEEISPNVFGVGQNHGHEFLEILFARRPWALDRRALLPRRGIVRCVGTLLRQADIGEVCLVPARPATGAAGLHDDPRIEAEEEHQSEKDEKAENADATAAATAAREPAAAAPWKWKTEAAALVAPILDVFALSLTAPAHRLNSSFRGKIARLFPQYAHGAYRRTRPHNGLNSGVRRAFSLRWCVARASGCCAASCESVPANPCGD